MSEALSKVVLHRCQAQVQPLSLFAVGFFIDHISCCTNFWISVLKVVK